MSIDDINIVQSNGKHAGQEVFHYHMHVIPRAPDDHIDLHWTPDEALRNDYDDLKKYISDSIK